MAFLFDADGKKYCVEMKIHRNRKPKVFANKFLNYKLSHYRVKALSFISRNTCKNPNPVFIFGSNICYDKEKIRI